MAPPSREYAPREYTPMDAQRNLANKRFVQAAQRDITQAPPGQLGEAIAAAYHEGADFRGTHPVNHLVGRAAIERQFWAHLRHALPDAERRELILAGGLYQGRPLVACYGQYLGTFAEDWFGIPATRQPLLARFCEAHELWQGRIRRSWVYLDYLDIMRQAGYWPLAPSLGQEGGWLAPRTNDGVRLTAQDEAVSRRCFALVMAMQAALGDYNGGPPTRAALDEMRQARYWRPDFMWYGPAGIGTTRGLRGFEDFHQLPFLVAFPDRGKARSEERRAAEQSSAEQSSGADPYAGHFIRIADGRFVVTGGWQHLRATHTGGEWLGLAPTGRPVAMRVMDFYRCELAEDGGGGDDRICENWVPIDIPHLLYQLGVDIFGRLRHQHRQNQALTASEFLLP